jgi:hypothetical protein
MNRKIVINTCYGAFSLSHKAFRRLRELGHQQALQAVDTGHYWPSACRPDEPSLNQCATGISRDDSLLIKVVEELGPEANGHCASLKIVEIPADIQWDIQGAHGVERVREAHREWT